MNRAHMRGLTVAAGAVAMLPVVITMLATYTTLLLMARLGLYVTKKLSTWGTAADKARLKLCDQVIARLEEAARDMNY